MRKFASIAIICMAVIGFSASLAFAKPTVKGLFNVDFDVTGWGGLEVGRNIVILTVTDATGKAVDDAKIEVKPWMPKMKHGIPIKPTVHDLGGGKYRTNVPLTMTGSWDVTITIKAGDKADNVTFVFKDITD